MEKSEGRASASVSVSGAASPSLRRTGSFAALPTLSLANSLNNLIAPTPMPLSTPVPQPGTGTLRSLVSPNAKSTRLKLAALTRRQYEEQRRIFDDAFSPAHAPQPPPPPCTPRLTSRCALL